MRNIPGRCPGTVHTPTLRMGGRGRGETRAIQMKHGRRKFNAQSLIYVDGHFKLSHRNRNFQSF
jgi:hypothetical protein